MTPIRVRFHPGARHPIIIETVNGDIPLTIPQATDLGLDMIRTIRLAQDEVEKRIYSYPKFQIKDISHECTI